jgi:ABC-type lipoprotein export system ATPase subunit
MSTSLAITDMSCLINPEINSSKERKTMVREEVRQRLAKALAIVNNPATVFCVQPFTSVARNGRENLGRLLARVMRDPDHALVVATGTAFVFAFAIDLARGENRGEFPVDTP